MSLKVSQSSFSMARGYQAPPAAVFAAWSDPNKKRAWLSGGDGASLIDHVLDFRVGGHEHARFRQGSTQAILSSEAVYLDIVPGQRLVLASTLRESDRTLAASLTIVEIQPAGGGSQVLLSEQGAFFAGGGGARERKAAWGDMLDALARVLVGGE